MTRARAIPPLTQMTVSLLTGFIGEYDLKWGGRGVNSDFSRLYLVRGGHGQGKVEYEDRTIILEPGKKYLFPAGRTADYSCLAAPFQLSWLHFSLEFIPGVSVFSTFAAPPAVPAGPGDAERFAEILDGLENASPAAMARRYALTLELLADFLPADWSAIMPSESAAARLAPALEYLSRQPETPFDLKSLARKVRLHPAYFSALFRKTFGTTPSRYQTERRLARAKTLLRATDKSLAEIAEDCGYQDPYFFARTFKKIVGVPPGRYRSSPPLF